MRALVVVAVALAAGCPNVPPADQLSVRGKLERDGIGGTSAQDVAISYASTNARGEWWSCELRMTATACDGDKHVNVWIALPNVQSLDELGGTGCVDGDGNPFGVFELLTDKLSKGDPIQIPGDVQVLTLVASDKDGDGVAALDSDDETAAASSMLTGDVELSSLGSFNDPVALSIAGLTAVDSLKLDIAMNGPTSPVPNPPTLDKSTSCVPGDAVK